jgi:hypothetical protein
MRTLSPGLIRAAIHPGAALSLAALVLLGALAGCGSDGPSAPVVKTDADLNVVVQAPTAPSLTTTIRTMWVKKGVDSEMRLYYRSPTSGADSTEFLRLVFDRRSLATRPNGSAIADGDSVLVTVTVPDPTRFLVDLEPTGLRFTPGREVGLKWKLGHRDHDLNDDGAVNATDSTLYTQLAVWRQETAGQPWARLASRLEVELDEIDVDLTGFSNYIVAY